MRALAKSVCLGVVACALAVSGAVGLAGPAQAAASSAQATPSLSLAASSAQGAYPVYRVPPRTPQPRTARIKALLRGSGVTGQAGWIVATLHGGPYRIGFQDGYLTAQSADYWIRVDLGAPGSASRKAGDLVAKKVVWHKIPRQYQLELKGIAAGLRAVGYGRDTLWDVVAANDWADQDCYAQLLRGPLLKTAFETSLSGRARKGGCSAFIATGTATTDGLPVMGHNTWSPYDENFMYNVMFYVYPSSGHAFCYQSAGGQIWSGQDWYENSAGLLLCETSLADTRYRPSGRPVFVRAREAAQYAGTVSQAVKRLLTGNNGAYCNEWLIGDRSGAIASLQMGYKVHDLHVTSNGFFGSSNYVWGKLTRKEEGSIADPPDPANDDYARFVRWGQFKTQYVSSGLVDTEVGKTMEADTFDTYLGKICPDERTLCGETEHGTTGAPYSSDYEGGAYDAKVCTESMARDLQLWARWGHPNGDPFSATLFLQSFPKWAADYGPLAVFGLRTFSAQTPNPWVLMGK
jgi:hypothetical protein